VSPARRRAANLLLVAGYPLAGWAGLGFAPMWRAGDTRRFLAFETGTALVVVGLALRRRPVEATLNAAVLLALAAAWRRRAA
jgi:hypothetical protein